MNVLFFVLVLCGIMSHGSVNSLDHHRLRLWESYDVLRNATTDVFLQYLDHFSTNTDKWEQRYFVNTEFFNDTNRDRALLYIGGESMSSAWAIQNGQCYASGKRYGGVMFVLEHRFYGRSQPFGDLSINNLKYLSSQQALGDLATFISAMNEKYNLTSDVKWIVFGGSYAGTLAAWMRLKYPHLVYGAVASSAPLFAKLEYPEYLQVVESALALHSDECVNNTYIALEQLESFFSGQAEENVTDIFNLCNEIEASASTDLDKRNLYEYIIDSFAYVVQAHGANPSVDTVCGILSNASGDKELHRLGQVTRLINGNGTETCFKAPFGELIADLGNVAITDTRMMRQWWYQTCSEFAWYQISNSENKAFGDKIPLSYFMTMCSDLYGTTFSSTLITEQVEKTNTEYGGYDIKISNAVFIQGSLDPWHPVGLTETRTEGYTVIVINGTTHCADLSNPSSTDPPQLIDAREEVQRLVGVWLGVNNSTKNMLSRSLFYIIIGHLISLMLISK